ncbi:hypothetical protein M513_13364, partial [Trichuris suis]
CSRWRQPSLNCIWCYHRPNERFVSLRQPDWGFCPSQATTNISDTMLTRQTVRRHRCSTRWRKRTTRGPT